LQTEETEATEVTQDDVVESDKKLEEGKRQLTPDGCVTLTEAETDEDKANNDQDDDQEHKEDSPEEEGAEGQQKQEEDQKQES